MVERVSVRFTAGSIVEGKAGALDGVRSVIRKMGR
jgi:hypothetical protein